MVRYFGKCTGQISIGQSVLFHTILKKIVQIVEEDQYGLARSSFLVYSCAIEMPKERPKTRKEHRQVKKAIYLSGQARDPYLHTPTLRADQAEPSRDHAASSGESVLPTSSTSTSDACPRCLPVLSKYQAFFEELTVDRH